MSDTVVIPFGPTNEDTAVLLLAAAAELELPSTVISTTSSAFLVPTEVHERAFGSRLDAPATAKKTAAPTTPKKAQE